MTGKPEVWKLSGSVRTSLVSPAAKTAGHERVRADDAYENQSCSPPVSGVGQWRIANRLAAARQERSCEIEKQARAEQGAQTRHAEIGQPVRNTQSGDRPMSGRVRTGTYPSIRNTGQFGPHTATPDKPYVYFSSSACLRKCFQRANER